LLSLQSKDLTYTNAKDFDEVLKSTNALRREQEEESRLQSTMRDQKMQQQRKYAVSLGLILLASDCCLTPCVLCSEQDLRATQQRLKVHLLFDLIPASNHSLGYRVFRRWSRPIWLGKIP
jgi:hypothetical protein